MFKKVLSLFSIGMVAAVLSVVSAAPAHAQVPTVSTIHSSVSVRIDNVKRQDLYAFLTNLENDALWYPGILSSNLVHTGPHGKLVGSQFQQVAFVTPTLTTTTTIDVLDAKPNKLFVIRGVGDFASYDATYTFEKAYNNANEGTVFTLTSTYVAPGFTKELFEQYITYALSGLIAHYNTTGAVTINYTIID